MSKSHFYGVISHLALFLLGLALGFRALDGHVTPPEADHYFAVVESSPVEKNKSYAVNLKVYRFQIDSAHFQSCNFRMIGYLAKDGLDNQIVPGQSILFSGYLMNQNQALYPDQFDYGKYLRNTGISGSVYIPKGEFEVMDNNYFSFRGKLNFFRSKLMAELSKDSIPVKEYGVLSALLVGDRSFLDPQLRDEFADAGAVHILAVSGLHVGIIYMLFLYVLNFIFKKRAALLKLILVLIILWGYAALTGFSPSVLRAATMFSFIALGKHRKRYSNAYNMLAASALCLLLFDPLLITQVGFQLSYLAVVGIIFYQPRFHSLLEVKNKYLDMAWSLLCVSGAAQLATFPLSMYYFHQFPLLFFVTNLLVIPLATIILYAGIPWLLLLWLPWVSDLLGWITIHSTMILNWGIGWINTLPFVKIDGIYVNSISVLTIYILINSITAFVIKPSRVKLRWCGISMICLTALIVYRKVENNLQDEILIPTLTEGATIMRIAKDRLVVYSNDTVNFKQTWERELYPYLLRRGICSDDDLDFVAFGNAESPLFVTDSVKSMNGHHIVWSPNENRVRVDTKDSPLLNYTDSTIIRINPYKLNRFSAYSPRPLKLSDR
jgi:competence protein ComEC